MLFGDAKATVTKLVTALQGCVQRGCGRVSWRVVTPALDIARTILDGFDKHYRLFRETGARAKYRFVRGDWAGDARGLGRAHPDVRPAAWSRPSPCCASGSRTTVRDESLWPEIKLAYIGLLHEHRQPECAETFYNSVACRVLDRRYYRNEYIFRRPAISTEHLDGEEPTYRCYYPVQRRAADDRPRGADQLRPGQPVPGSRSRRAVHRPRPSRRFPGPCRAYDNFQIQVLSSLFFRNKTAYVVGRAVNGNDEYPFVAPLLRNDDGTIYVDTLLLKPENIGRVFSLARSYFMVDMEVPVGLRRVPADAAAQQAEGGALHAARPAEAGQDAVLPRPHGAHAPLDRPLRRRRRARAGMVMAVFTLPSFPYVFKVIRDWFEPPKDTDRRDREGQVPAREVPRPRGAHGRHARVLERRAAARPLRAGARRRSCSASRLRRSRSTTSSSSSATSTSSGG